MQLAQQDNMDHPRLKMTIRSPAPTHFLRCAVNANFVPLANGQQKLVWPLTMIVLPARKDISKCSNHWFCIFILLCFCTFFLTKHRKLYSSPFFFNLSVKTNKVRLIVKHAVQGNSLIILELLVLMQFTTNPKLRVKFVWGQHLTTKLEKDNANHVRQEKQSKGLKKMTMTIKMIVSLIAR